MRPRAFTPIETLPLVGGSLCLDFTNTTGNRAGTEPRERLGSYRDLVVFAQRTGILGKRAARALVAASADKPREAERALAGAVTLREALYRLLLAALHGRRPEASDLELLNEHQSRAFERRRLVWSSGKPRWSSPATPEELDRIEGSLVTSATELLTSEELGRLRKCGECDWLFLDTSKNGSRRWCKKACGDRVKARRYYRRKKQRA